MNCVCVCVCVCFCGGQFRPLSGLFPFYPYSIVRLDNSNLAMALDALPTELIVLAASFLLDENDINLLGQANKVEQTVI